MKNILHEQSSATATGSSSDAGAGKSARFDDAHQQLAKQHGGESSAHPHHLKYGKVDVGGFEPAELDGDESLSPLKQNANDEQQSHHDERQRQKMHRDHTCELLDAEARRIHASRRYLLRTPRPQQYFRGSVLVRSHEERSSDKLELFFDLVFVGIISVLAQSAVERATGYALLEYVIVYSMAYTIWCWMREMFNTFFKDDLYQGLLTLFVMACLVLFGNNAINAEETLNSSELSTGRIMAVSAYLVAELAIFSTWFLYSFYIKPYRAQLRAHCIVWLFSTALWIGVIFVRDNAVIAMSIVALFLEWSAYLFIYSPVFKRTLKLRYSSAVSTPLCIRRCRHQNGQRCGTDLCACVCPCLSSSPLPLRRLQSNTRSNGTRTFSLSSWVNSFSVSCPVIPPAPAFMQLPARQSCPWSLRTASGQSTSMVAAPGRSHTRSAT